MSKVYRDNNFIIIEGYHYHLSVSFEGVYGLMSLSDFSKMLKVVGNVLDPHDYAEYLQHWNTRLDKQLPTASIRELPRLQKMLARVDKAFDKLPAWVLEEE